MNPIDKEILWILDDNCRATYQSIGLRTGITANAVKKRIKKLMENGVLVNLYITLSRAMIDAELVLADVRTDGSHNYDSFIDNVGHNPMVSGIMPTSSGGFIVIAQCIGSTGLSELGQLIRKQDGVENVEIHPLLGDRGEKMEFTNLQLRVVKHLLEDARMSVPDLAERSKLSARRVRRILHQLLERRAILFTTSRNVNAGDSTAFLARIGWDGSKTDHNSLDEELNSIWPVDYWFAFTSSVHPILYGVFVVGHIRDMETVFRKIREIDGVKSVVTLLFYPTRYFIPLTRSKLEEMVERAGV